MQRMQRAGLISPERHFGLECLRIETRHSAAIVALHGGQLLSWVPHGERDVLWRSRVMLSPPKALRGGVPLCWPWFGGQGPDGSPAHGVARTSQWEVVHVADNSPSSVKLTLRPRPESAAARDHHLSVTTTILIAEKLTQTVTTHNVGQAPFALTQALHSYLAVGDASRIGIDGIRGAVYLDKLTGAQRKLQTEAFKPDTACDRIYCDTAGRYSLNDPVWRRSILIESAGSHALVVWNPGADISKTISDLEPDAWRDFYCVEVANAGPDAIVLAPGASHQLTQTISLQPWPAAV
ncbi:MAG: hypothetical protein RJA63_1920 [Pseudomonadota bacterium]|jgi:glucose-6-phosphate 1-epimerase